jgi:hypothetical protein
MDTFASLEELKKRLDWTLDEGEERVAETALEDASDLARAYGRDWDTSTAPRLVRTLVLKASARYMKNYQGYILSRAGDETVQWSDKAGEDMGTVYFSKDEIKLIEGLAGRRTSLISVPVVAYAAKAGLDNGYRPIVGGGKEFPMFEIGEQP